MFSQHKVKKSLYEILEIKRDAVQDDIKKAYHKLSLKFHPDKITQSKLTVQEAEKKFKQILNAYEILSDPVKRAEYDSRTHPTTPSADPKKSGGVYVPRSDGYTFGDWKLTLPADFNERYAQSPSDFFDRVKAIIRSENTQAIEDLVKRYSLTMPDFLKGCLYFSVLEGRYHSAKYLIEVMKVDPKFTVLNLSLNLQGSLLKCAVASGCLALVAYFVEVQHFNIEANATTLAGCDSSALSVAVKQGHSDIVTYLLLHRANPNPKVANSDVLNLAIEKENFEIFNQLIEAGTWYNKSHLLKAFHHSNEAILARLLALVGESFVANLTKHDLIEVITSGQVGYLNHIQNHPCLLANENYLGYLYAAASSGSAEMTRFFIEQTQFSCSSYKIQALLEAAVGYTMHGWYARKASSGQRLDVLKYLFEEKKLSVPESVLRELMKKKVEFLGIHVQAYLQSIMPSYQPYREALRYVSINGLHGLPLPTLLRLYNVGIPYKSDLQTYSSEIVTLIAASPDFDEVFHTLAPLSPQFRQDVLFYLCGDGCGQAIDRLKQLVELGVNINARNEHGRTPLIVAMMKSPHPRYYNDTVKYLLQCGANVYQADGFGRTPYDYLQDVPEFQRDFCRQNTHTFTRKNRG